MTYVFGRGDGHDVLASLFVAGAPLNSAGEWSEDVWLRSRFEDKVLLVDLNPEDVTIL